MSTLIFSEVILKLNEYFESYSISIAKFAKRCKVSRTTLHKILNGADIRVSVAVKIELSTRGEVTCKELLSHEILKQINQDLGLDKTSSKPPKTNKSTKNP